MDILEKLKAFWTFVSTPGTEMPIGVTIGVFAVVIAFIILAPAYAQWRVYRKQNPLPTPEEKFKAKAAASKKKKSSKKKHH